MRDFVDTRRISPLCQPCWLADFADKEGFDNHQCEECRKKAEETMEKRNNGDNMDGKKVIRIIDELIFEAQKAPTWKAENALRCLKKELLKEQEAMVKPTKCPCGELFDAKDSSFCPKCGCAYGELSGRYTNIGR